LNAKSPLRGSVLPANLHLGIKPAMERVMRMRPAPRALA